METVERKGNLPSGAGRPPIGPKAQTHVPPEVAAYIRRTARSRKVRPSVVTRELILAGYSTVVA